LNLRPSGYEPDELTGLLHPAISGRCNRKLKWTSRKPFLHGSV
jgi:hypothetical protein